MSKDLSVVENLEEASAEETPFTQVVSYLERKSIRFNSSEAAQRVDIGLRSGSFVVNLHIVTNAIAQPLSLAVAVVQMPLLVPETKRQEALQMLTRLNYELMYGSMEMDFSDGEVRVRHAVFSETGRFSDDMLDFLLAATMSLVRRIEDPLLEVAFGVKQPGEEPLNLALLRPVGAVQ